MTRYFYVLLTAVMMTCFSCSSQSLKKLAASASSSVVQKTASGQFPISFSVTQSSGQFKMPALHSFAVANYNNLLVFIGGQKSGFHGTTSNPPAFLTTTANDSIWVVDIAGKQSWGVPVPAAYYNYLTATNPQSWQVADSLYMCGGYTRTDPTSKTFNATSDHFFQFNLPNLVKYVQTGGYSPAISQVITKVITSPYIQVTGGELLVANNYFYLIGGQNYNAAYTAGRKGIYTNAIRKFRLQAAGQGWQLSDTLSVIDTVNLHRRDMNVVAYPSSFGLLATLYGGVFTANDQAYLHPIEISGLDTGQPTIRVDTSSQLTNEYSTAKATIWFNNSGLNFTAFLGGISYMEYSTAQQKLVVGDNGVPMPFSNIISTTYQLGQRTPFELIQIPPGGPFLPAYLGSNGVFVPLAQYALAGRPDIIDGNKIPDATSTLIGYLYGGIRSLGPTSGTTPKGYIATFANPLLYEVYLNLSSGVAKQR